VAWEREPDAGGDEAMRFLGGILTDHGERHLPGLHVLQSFAAGNQFTVGRKNRGDADNVARGDARVPEGELEARKSFTMFTDAFGEENFLRNERHGAGLPCLRDLVWSEKFNRCGKVTRRYCSVNAIPNLRAQSAKEL